MSVKAAISGPMALKIVENQQRPDLILLDIRMPGMDGYEVCHRLKSNPEISDVPVIFLNQLKTGDDENGREKGNR